MWLYKDEYDYMCVSSDIYGGVFLYVSGNNPLKIKSEHMCKINLKLYEWYADE